MKNDAKESAMDACVIEFGGVTGATVRKTVQFTCTTVHVPRELMSLKVIDHADALIRELQT